MDKKYVIDHKFISLTKDEWSYYQQLVQEFSDHTKSGADYFIDIFDADDDGLILNLRLPMTKQIPWAIVVFMQNVVINQQLRSVHREIDTRFANLEDKIMSKLEK